MLPGCVVLVPCVRHPCSLFDMSAVLWSVALGYWLGLDLWAQASVMVTDIPTKKHKAPKEVFQLENKSLVEQKRIWGLCTMSCSSYSTGVAADTNPVCIESDGSCKVGTSDNCGSPCLQIFAESCPVHCSEWGGDNMNSLDVCQSITERYKCNLKDAAQCTQSGGERCKQLPVLQCMVNCDQYVGNVDQDSHFVCQNTEPGNTDFGDCLELPCALGEGASSHSDPEYKKSAICIQSHNECMQICSATSPSANDTTVCQDQTSFDCSNDRVCPSPKVRCRPVYSQRNLGTLLQVPEHTARPLMRAEAGPHQYKDTT